jgi:polyketide cyclase/dehydrase/lipid transport protein
VFDFFDDLANAAVFVPRLDAITLVEPLANGGRRVEYTTRTESGEIAPASSEHLEYEPPRRTVTRGVQAGIATVATREFEAAGSGTRVTATVEWTVPVRYVAALITAPLRGPLRRSLRASLAAAKHTVEE